MDNEETFILREREDQRKHRTIRFSVVMATVCLLAMFYLAHQCDQGFTERSIERARAEAQLDMARPASTSQAVLQNRQTHERYYTCVLELPPLECQLVFRDPSVTAQAERAYSDCRRAGGLYSTAKHCAEFAKVYGDAIERGSRKQPASVTR